MNKYTLRQSPLAAAVGALVAVGPVHAATITVTTNADVPVGTLPGECTLRSAIASANLTAAVDGCAAGTAGGNEIVFDNSLAHSTITLGQGEMAITRALTITGPVPGDPAGMTIDGDNASRLFVITGAIPTIDGDNASRLFATTGAVPGDFDFGLNNLTLTRGRTSAVLEHGGAVLAYSANVLLDHVLVTGNSTTGYGAMGGGLAVIDGDAVLVDSTVSDNSTASDYAVGAGLAVVFGDTTLTGSTVSGNTTAGISGYGGGMYFADGIAALTNSTVTGNSTAGGAAGGGGLRMTSGDVTVINSTISGNSTTGFQSSGGGLSINEGEATIINSTVFDNSTLGDSAHGGGVFVDEGTVVNLTNSTLSGNSTAGAGADGGALYVAGDGDTFLTHVTVAFNTAASGTDGIHKYVDSVNFGGVGLYNSMVVQAGAGETACNSAPAAVNSLATDAGCTGTATPLADIALNPLADNGGPTPTHELDSSSVAIDAAGDCETDYGVDRDQRGQARPGIDSAACDIGAFEVQGPAEPVLDIAPALLDFGTVPVGQTSAPQTLTLTSSGNTAVEVQAVDTPGVPFSLTGGTCPAPPFSLDPVQSCTLEYTFAPAGTGVASEMLQITSDDPASPHGFELSGEGQTLTDEIFIDRFEN